MELALVIWAVLTLPSIGAGIAFIGCMVCLVAAGVKVILTANGINRKSKHAEPGDVAIANMAHWAIVIFLPLWILGVIIPNKDTAQYMLAAYGVQTIVKNESAQELAKDGVDVLKQLLQKTKADMNISTEK